MRDMVNESGWSRYAVYYTLPPGPLADFAAAWLGWDIASGGPGPSGAAEPEGLPAPRAELTAEPRRYGFHATLKPPFRLVEGESEASLAATLGRIAGRLAPAIAEGGLSLAALGRFLALRPEGGEAAIGALAARLVEGLDRFRAPAAAAELTRRRGAGLSPAQDENLLRWGYPYVMDEFRMHMTLTGALDGPARERALAALRPVVQPLLPSPFALDAVSLCGEDSAGRFRLIHRYTLAG